MSKNVTQAQLSRLLGVMGLVLAAVLLTAAIAAWKGRNFATEQVTSQLTQEKISFPAAGSKALDPAVYPGLQRYAGQLVDNGAKAKAYANEYIWEHMMKASGGKTYAEISAAAQANPQDPKLAALKNTLFQGDMLRSSLLTAYAFSVFGQLAGIAFVLTLAAAILVLALSLACLARAKRR
jgi:hypothetical protein